MKHKINTNRTFRLLPRTWSVFTADDPLRMAAATAFFTMFALPPILFIVVRSMGLVFNEPMGREIFARLDDVVGPDSSRQVRETLSAFRQLGDGWYVSLFVIVLLTFVATNLFRIIQDSINQLWLVRQEHERTLRQKLQQRWHGVVIILLTSVLFGTTVLAEGLQSYLGALLDDLFPGIAGYLDGLLNTVISLLLVSAWFTLLFRVLPDGRPEWRLAAIGGGFTGVLFTGGKFVLRVLLIQSDVNSLFGASAAFVLLLLFVFYCSLILYFGAAFTKAWSEIYERKIVLKPGAIRFRWVKVKED